MSILTHQIFRDTLERISIILNIAFPAHALIVDFVIPVLQITKFVIEELDMASA